MKLLGYLAICLFLGGCCHGQYFSSMYILNNTNTNLLFIWDKTDSILVNAGAKVKVFQKESNGGINEDYSCSFYSNYYAVLINLNNEEVLLDMSDQNNWESVSLGGDNCSNNYECTLVVNEEDLP